MDLFEDCITRDVEPDIHALFQELKSCCAKFDSVYVLLDAFDECDTSQQGSILSLVRELVFHPSVKAMITTRPYLQGVHALSEMALVVDIKARDTDVRAFLVSRLQSVQYLSESLKSEAIEVISGGAEGM